MNASRFATCQNVLRNEDMASDLDILVEAGVRQVGVLGALAQKTGIAETAKLLRERRLSACSYIPGLQVLQADPHAADQGLRDGLNAAAALGAPYLTVGTGSAGSLSGAQADERYVGCLERAAPLARELGVRMAIEPIHPLLRLVGHVNTIRHAAELAARVDGVAIVFDCVHLFWDRDLPADIERHIGRVCAVQLSNVDPQAIAEKRWVRCPIDRGIVPVAQIVRMLEAAGFRGVYEDETLMSRPRAECIEGVRAARLWFEALRGTN